MFKKLLKKENLILIIVLFLFGHNILLQNKIDKATKLISIVKNYTIIAANNASVAADYAASAGAEIFSVPIICNPY